MFARKSNWTATFPCGFSHHSCKQAFVLCYARRPSMVRSFEAKARLMLKTKHMKAEHGGGKGLIYFLLWGIILLWLRLLGLRGRHSELLWPSNSKAEPTSFQQCPPQRGTPNDFQSTRCKRLGGQYLPNCSTPPTEPFKTTLIPP